jgi:integrase
MANSVPHLHRDRLGTFYFRITVFGRTTKRSLRTKDAQLATMRAACLNWELHHMPTPSVADILQAHQEGRTRKFDVDLPSGAKLKNINTEADHRRAMELISKLPREAFIAPTVVATGPALPEQAHQKGAFFKTVAKKYVDELRSAGLEETKGIEDKEKTYSAIVEEFENPRIGAINKELVGSFKAIALKTGGAGRVNKKLGHLSVLFQWAIDNGHAHTNPAEGMRVGTKHQQARKVQHYEPFTDAELRKIFGAKAWAIYATKPHFHWVPFLLLYTGARPDEIAGMPLENVRREGGIDYFAITAGKTTSSLRKVPFHKAIKASGFMAYLAQRRKEEPGGMLFPELRPTKNGYVKNVSRRFNEQHLRELRIDQPTKRLVSFRHTFITRMSENNVHPAMLMAIVGHYEQDAVDLNSPHFKGYNGTKKIKALRDTIDKFGVKLPVDF